MELSKLEGSLEKSGDQTREELRTMKQMFEQSEQSKTASKMEYLVSFIFGVCSADIDGYRLLVAL